MDNNKIGSIIKESRKAKNMTQKDLADLLHITDRAVSKWERGLCAPDISLLEPLSEILEITVTELLSGKQNEEQNAEPAEEDVVCVSKKECSFKYNHRVLLSVLFLISLLPMLLNQYGGMKGVQEITGLINLLNPIGVTAVILFILGILVQFKKSSINWVLGFLGTIGIVISEIYKFFTWHVMNITGELSFQNSIQLAFPEFYIGLAVSIAMVIVYCVLRKEEY